MSRSVINLITDCRRSTPQTIAICLPSSSKGSATATGIDSVTRGTLLLGVSCFSFLELGVLRIADCFDENLVKVAEYCVELEDESCSVDEEMPLGLLIGPPLRFLVSEDFLSRTREK